MNNIYYHINHVHIDYNALAQLPDDRNLTSIAVASPTASDQQVSMTEECDNLYLGRYILSMMILTLQDLLYPLLPV